MNITELIEQGENSAVEFKTADVRPESLAKEIVAFANGHGGVVLVGVADNGQVTGLENPAHFNDWVANIARTSINPPITVDMSVVDMNVVNELALPIGVIHVPKGADKTLPNQCGAIPYSCRRHQPRGIYSGINAVISASGCFSCGCQPSSGCNN